MFARMKVLASAAALLRKISKTGGVGFISLAL
jgi:hypothetical protein